MIPVFEPTLTAEAHSYVSECMSTNWISSQGDFITKFETKLSKLHEDRHCAVTSSCTTALHLALLACDIGPGDEVICPDLTFIAPVNMISLTGAKPVLCDVETDTFCMSVDTIRPKITNRTKAIVVVHAFGHLANMPEILELVKKYNLRVIEDVAEAPGGMIGNKIAGTFGDISCFSFFANKIFTSGEGGACLSSDDKIIERIKILRDHGMSMEKRYYHTVTGFNYRMTNLQAAIGLSQVEQFDEIIHRRKSIEDLYIKFFKDNEKIKYRHYADWCKGVFWLATVTIPEMSDRKHIISKLMDKGIECRQMVFPVHEAPPYHKLANDSLKNSIFISHKSLHLPSSSNLNREQIQFITDSLVAAIDEQC